MGDVLGHRCKMLVCKLSVNFSEKQPHFSKFPGCIVEGYDRHRMYVIVLLNDRCELSVNITVFLARFPIFLTWYIEGDFISRFGASKRSIEIITGKAEKSC